MKTKLFYIFLGILVLVTLFVFNCSQFTYLTYTYTLTFNSQGGTEVPSQNIDYGELVSEPTDPTRPGYSFDGWYKESDCINAWNFAIYMVTENVTIYAKWVILVDYYTITFDKNHDDATGDMPDQSIASGSSENLLTCTFTKLGSAFIGWATDPIGDVVYADGASYTMGAADVTLYAKWTWDTYNLRDNGPAGGLIFYINPNADTDGWKYMEAAPSDQSADIQWYNGSSTMTEATATAIGTGNANTTTIVTSQGDGSYAAQLCDDLTIESYNDWFLPSKDELNAMYVNLKSQGVGGFADSWYWSSSEYALDCRYARGQFFDSGWQYVKEKNSTLHVRAARTF